MEGDRELQSSSEQNKCWLFWSAKGKTWLHNWLLLTRGVSRWWCCWSETVSKGCVKDCSVFHYFKKEAENLRIEERLQRCLSKLPPLNTWSFPAPGKFHVLPLRYLGFGEGWGVRWWLLLLAMLKEYLKLLMIERWMESWFLSSFK